MSMATKSIISYLPIRARTKRTRSSIACINPNLWNACATTATSPNQGGVLGSEVRAAWMWTEESVMAVSSLSQTPSDRSPLLRKTHFCRSCQFLDDLPPLGPRSITRCVSRGEVIPRPLVAGNAASLFLAPTFNRGSLTFLARMLEYWDSLKLKTRSGSHETRFPGSVCWLLRISVLEQAARRGKVEPGEIA